MSFDGAAWSRRGDTLGVAIAQNTISAAQRAYLEAGGRSYFLGDGRLAFEAERIVEGYYSWSVLSCLWATVDLQEIANPGYNRARGPVTVGSLRVHWEL